jgi:PPM family protein phosphatase
VDLDVVAHTITGRRENNEDASIALRLGERTYLLAVADGMGGFAGGEVASSLVLESVSAHLTRQYGGRPLDPSTLRKAIEEVFPLAQARLREKKSSQPGLEGMGTTLSCALVSGDAFVIGNIGDSRVYLFRDGVFRQITEDHTHIQELQKETGRRADEAIVRAYGHFLTRSLDGGAEQPDLFPCEEGVFTFRPGDAIMLCSDGLIADKRDEAGGRWSSILIGTATLIEAAKRLVKDAFDSGSADNITVVLATYGDFPRRTVRGQSLFTVSRLLAACGLVVAAALVLAGIAVFGEGGSPDVGATSHERPASPSIVPPLEPAGNHAVAPWSPFAEGASSVGFRLSETYSWGEYHPAADVDHYEVTIGDRKAEVSQVNYLELRKIPGLGPGVHRVNIRVVLKNGSYTSATNKVRIQR